MDTQYKLAEIEPFDLSKNILYHDVSLDGKHVRSFVGPKGWVISIQYNRRQADDEPLLLQ